MSAPIRARVEAAAVAPLNVRPSAAARSLAGYIWPPLTTIRQPTRRMGYDAADMLLSEEAEAVERCEVPFELVVRDSTGPRFPVG